MYQSERKMLSPNMARPIRPAYPQNVQQRLGGSQPISNQTMQSNMASPQLGGFKPAGAGINQPVMNGRDMTGINQLSQQMQTGGLNSSGTDVMNAGMMPQGFDPNVRGSLAPSYGNGTPAMQQQQMMNNKVPTQVATLDAPQQITANAAPQAPVNSPAYGLSGAMGTLAGGYQQGMQNLQQGQQVALGALQGTRQDVLNQQNNANQYLQQGATMGANAIQQGSMMGMDQINQARSDVTGALSGARSAGMGALSAAGSQLSGAINQGRGDVNQGRDAALSSLNENFGQARQDLAGYGAGGIEAGQVQAALSGAMGAEAQRAAMDQTMNSPEFDFIQEQGRRELLANAAATGGTGGGEILRDLTSFGQGLASQRFDTAYNRLSGITDRGLNAAGQRSSIAQNLGAQTANTNTQAAQQLSQLQQTLGQGQANLGAAGANLSGQLGSAQASSMGQLGGQAASLMGNAGNTMGQLAGNMANSQANAAAATGTNLSNLGADVGSMFQRGGELGFNAAQNAASQLAGYQTQAGRDISANMGTTAAGMAGLINDQGSQIAGQFGGAAANIANILQQAGISEAGDSTRMAELLQALATQSAAGGSAAIGNAGAVSANATLAGAGQVNNLLGELAGAYGTYAGSKKT